MQPRGAVPLRDPSAWFFDSDYPVRDRNGEEGTTRYRLSVGPDGRVADCQIIETSGFKALDEATCRALIRRGRFSPATNYLGEVTWGSFSGKKVWARTAG